MTTHFGAACAIENRKDSGKNYEVVVAFFFLPFVAVLFIFVDFVVLVSPANATKPLSRERPSIRLMIFFIGGLILLGKLLTDVNCTKL